MKLIIKFDVFEARLLMNVAVFGDTLPNFPLWFVQATKNCLGAISLILGLPKDFVSLTVLILTNR